MLELNFKNCSFSYSSIIVELLKYIKLVTFNNIDIAVNTVNGTNVSKESFYNSLDKLYSIIESYPNAGKVTQSYDLYKDGVVGYPTKIVLDSIELNIVDTLSTARDSKVLSLIIGENPALL